MRINRTLRSAVIASLLASGGVWASSDYLLQIEGIKGEAASQSPPALEVMSFSFGASQSGAVGNGLLGAGRMAPSSRHQKTGHVTLMKREAAPVATPSAPVADVDVDGEGMTAVMAPRSSGPGAITLHVDGPSAQVAARQASVCAQGKHFPSATLSGLGKTWVLSDVMVSSCAMADGQQAVSLSFQTIEMR